MKKILLSALMILMLSVPAFAFLYEIKMLNREEIQKLNDSQLEEAYINARIEEKASEEFHIGAGFSSSKDYESRKALLRYIFELRREIAKREQMKVDELDQNLK